MNVFDQFRMDGKTAIVTGGNRGLGKEMAHALASAGAQVAIVCRSAERASNAAEAITTETNAICRGYACNVTQQEQVYSLIGNVLTDFGQIDVLINNAGINIRGPIDELTLEEFQEVQQINVTGPWLMCRAIAPHMKERRYGRVINVGSTLSIISMPDRTPYASSKGAILQMTRTLSLEWAPHNITVNAMLPGPFATEMNQSIMDDPEAYKNFIAKIPLGRWGALHEIHGLTLFLASDASSFVTGAGITIDGGWTAY
ncbi:glucose 1-dehydrogenase [Chloroflexi bacterium TSY]|nr:glucose 1-dehydrogenase [Chloroflexi bacterium TSY]